MFRLHFPDDIDGLAISEEEQAKLMYHLDETLTTYSMDISAMMMKQTTILTEAVCINRLNYFTVSSCCSLVLSGYLLCIMRYSILYVVKVLSKWYISSSSLLASSSIPSEKMKIYDGTSNNVSSTRD